MGLAHTVEPDRERHLICSTWANNSALHPPPFFLSLSLWQSSHLSHQQKTGIRVTMRDIMYNKFSQNITRISPVCQVVGKCCQCMCQGAEVDSLDGRKDKGGGGEDVLQIDRSLTNCSCLWREVLTHAAHTVITAAVHPPHMLRHCFWDTRYTAQRNST